MKIDKEFRQLNLMTMVTALTDLDCLVCPMLKIKGGQRDITLRCSHPDMPVQVRLRKQLGEVPKWCPRRKVMLKELG